MGEICCDTWSVDNIVECELGDERGCLEEERQWLELRDQSMVLGDGVNVL